MGHTVNQGCSGSGRRLPVPGSESSFQEEEEKTDLGPNLKKGSDPTHWKQTLLKFIFFPLLIFYYQSFRERKTIYYYYDDIIKSFYILFIFGYRRAFVLDKQTTGSGSDLVHNMDPDRTNPSVSLCLYQ